MTEPSIVFEHVWKKFHRGEVHDSLRDLIPAMARRLVRRGPGPGDLEQDDFWALQDVSFRVSAGQTLGIIGANGSGKSTTLRLLTRILEPTRGHLEVTGRIGALIEISAGFHGDLTGRENIFLQGAIMGMRTDEIARRFDDIVDFAGIAEFIDTPVKRYSTGMNARLGFAIAAHLNPDVLIIDEVLAVGDFLFQKRAFGRIRQLAHSGIPVVIVSHQLDRIAELCTEAILLDHGRPLCHASPAECIRAYVQDRPEPSAEHLPDAPVDIRSIDLIEGASVRSGEWIVLRVHGVIRREVPEGLEPLLIRVRSVAAGQVLFYSGVRQLGVELPMPGPFTIDVRLQMNLESGNYLVIPSSFDIVRDKHVGQLPGVMVHVGDPGTFRGSVQLNPEMRLIRESRSLTGVGKLSGERSLDA